MMLLVRVSFVPLKISACFGSVSSNATACWGCGARIEGGERDAYLLLRPKGAKPDVILGRLLVSKMFNGGILSLSLSAQAHLQDCLSNVLHPRCVGISSDNFLVVTSSLSGLPKGNEEVPSGK